MRRGARLRSTGCPTLSGSGPWTARSCPRTSRSWTGRATPARWWSRPVPSRRPPPGKSPCRACTPLSRPHSTRAGKRDRPGPAAGSAGRCGPLLHHPACRRPGRTDLPRRPRHRTRAGRPAGPGRGGGAAGRRRRRPPRSWTGVTDQLRSAGYTDAELIAAGVGFRSARGTVVDVFRSRVLFPAHDEQGAPGRLGRPLDASGAPARPALAQQRRRGLPQGRAAARPARRSQPPERGCGAGAV